VHFVTVFAIVPSVAKAQIMVEENVTLPTLLPTTLGSDGAAAEIHAAGGAIANSCRLGLWCRAEQEAGAGRGGDGGGRTQGGEHSSGHVDVSFLCSAIACGNVVLIALVVGDLTSDDCSLLLCCHPANTCALGMNGRRSRFTRLADLSAGCDTG
jgi:hypothetical protein